MAEAADKAARLGNVASVVAAKEEHFVAKDEALGHHQEVPPQPEGWARRPVAFLHRCLGKEHHMDLGDCIRRKFDEQGLQPPLVMACDACNGHGFDLLNHGQF